MLVFVEGLTTNRQPLTISVVYPLEAVNPQFMLDWTALSSTMCFSVSFDGWIVTVDMDKEHTFPSKRFGLFRPSSVAVCAEEGLERLKRLDRNMCSRPCLL